MIGKLTIEEIEEVLTKNMLGRIGCNDGYNTYVTPINYVYDGKYIIAHSLLGMKIKIMRQNPRVCFEVEEIKNFSNWKSVIVIGEYQELISERERYSVMQLFIDRMLKVKMSETAILNKNNPELNHKAVQSNKSVIYRICIEEKLGRFEKESYEME